MEKASGARRVLTVALAAAVIAGTAAAQPVDRGSQASRQISEWLAVELYTGYLNGISGEYVYEDGRKVSQLDWRIQGMSVIGGSLAVKPGDWLTLQVGGWVPFASRNKMDDYDWLVAPYGAWSHWSNHPDTRINHASMIDGRAVVRVAQFGFGPGRGEIGVLGGWRRLNFSWTAHGGTFIYSSDSGFRDDVGTIPAGTKVISYEQWFETPYVGVAAQLAHREWTFQGEVIGSLWGTARGRDDHHMRMLLFHDRDRRMAMVGATGTAAYRLNDALSLTGRVEYQHYFLAKGPTTELDYSAGVTTEYRGDASGIDHRSLLVSVGVRAALP